MPPGPRPVTREQIPIDQRERIIDAAASLIAKRGFHNTTIELIVRRAKVGYATFYRNFADKEELFLAVFDFAGAEVRRQVVEAVVTEADAPWADRVAAGLRAVYLLISENPVYARVCLVESLSAGAGGAARYEQALRNFDPLLRPGRKLRPANAELPETLESTLVGGVFWIAYQRLLASEADRLMELLPEAIELVLSPYIGEAEAVEVAERFAVKTG